MRPERILGTILLTLGLVGSAASATAGQKKEDVILAELRQIQAQLAELQTSQAALKSAVDALTSEASTQQDSLRKTFADSKVTIERIQQDMSILTERVDETNERLSDIHQEMASLKQSREPLVLPPAPGMESSADEIQTAQQAPGERDEEPLAVAPVLTATPDVTDIYNQARIDYTQGRYPLAISGFKDVLELDARGDLADNAHYWMGECYLAQRQNDQALAEFDRIIRDYPESNKRPDAYLKKAMTLEAMGRRSEANLMYELVIEQFPRTTQERVARRKLEELMKTTIREERR